MASNFSATALLRPILGTMAVRYRLGLPSFHPATGLMYVLIVVVILGNLIYLSVDCPHHLAPDEAHYWHWSQHLDWSYYSKGPLVAWVIRASCELFAGLSVRLVGTEVLAVRLPAVIFHALLLIAIYQLSRETFRRPWLALGTVAAAITIPAVNALAVIMTIDSPFLCCWAWACLFGQRAILQPERQGLWIAAGLVTALGILAKYTMLLFPASVGLFLLMTPALRRQLLEPGFWWLCGTAALGGIPIVIWNAQHDWVSFRHVSVQAGVTATSTTPVRYFLGPVGYLAGQFGLWLGYWLVAWFAAIVCFRPRPGSDPRFAYLWWLSMPIWFFFALVSVRTKVQVNWPAPAYLTGLVLTFGWIARQLASPSRRWRQFAAGCLALAISLGVAVTIFARYPGIIRPVLHRFAPAATAYDRTPIRKLDPTTRLAGWHDLGITVGRIRDELIAAERMEPVIVGMNWMLPGELAFYCPGHPTVYSIGTILHDRHSQYDLWRPNPVADAQVYLGRTFVYVGEFPAFFWDCFATIEKPVEVLCEDRGIPVAAWRIWVCRGFRGFPTAGARRESAGY